MRQETYIVSFNENFGINAKRFRSLNKLIGPITFYCPRRMRNIMCQNKKEKLMKKIKHKKSEQNKISCVKQDTCT